VTVSDDLEAGHEVRRVARVAEERAEVALEVCLAEVGVPDDGMPPSAPPYSLHTGC
jgi:hypothetical protein